MKQSKTPVERIHVGLLDGIPRPKADGAYVYYVDYHALELECAELRKDAERYQWLKEQAGYYQDGSQTVVELVQDDATRTCFIKVGSKYYGKDGCGFNAAIDAALEDSHD
ncbi:MAG: hypothetical protein WCC12_15755 [Anaerolineales bacterium]